MWEGREGGADVGVGLVGVVSTGMGVGRVLGGWRMRMSAGGGRRVGE